mmetsp:Transcript_33351/g.70166  ORF Transcript_33351/g.70166 Transcript_33351/m.70166 type:complete len:216 (-) Transcript_33351:271-918(-)
MPKRLDSSPGYQQGASENEVWRVPGATKHCFNFGQFARSCLLMSISDPLAQNSLRIVATGTSTPRSSASSGSEKAHGSNSATLATGTPIGCCAASTAVAPPKLWPTRCTRDKSAEAQSAASCATSDAPCAANDWSALTALRTSPQRCSRKGARNPTTFSRLYLQLGLLYKISSSLSIVCAKQPLPSSCSRATTTTPCEAISALNSEYISAHPPSP